MVNTTILTNVNEHPDADPDFTVPEGELINASDDDKSEEDELSEVLEGDMDVETGSIQSDEIVLIISTDSGMNELTFSSDTTVADVIEQMGLDPEDYEVVADGRKLQTNSTLTANGVKNHSILKAQKKMINIKVEIMNGRTEDLAVPQSCTGAYLKSKLGRGGENMRLFYRGKNLDDSKSLKSQNVANGSAINANYRLYGG